LFYRNKKNSSSPVVPVVIKFRQHKEKFLYKKNNSELMKNKWISGSEKATIFYLNVKDENTFIPAFH